MQLNGQQAYVFESEEALSLQAIEQGLPLYMRIQEKQTDRFSSSDYRLPDKILLPSPEATKIRAANGRYQCELFVNL
jgi:hypothetical protein